MLSLLLLVGKLLRVGIPLLQKLYLPSSVIGGIAGLVVIQLFPGAIDRELITAAGKIPGFLINVIFASLFLGMATPKVGEMLKLAFPQLCFGQILAWGQYVLGLGITGFVLAPLFGVPPAFGNLLEIGFQGGHGTVGGMTSVFENFDWRDGIALGYTVATAGMIIAVIVGMVLINWATRNGYIVCTERRDNSDAFRLRGIYRRDEQPAAGRQTVLCDSIDSLGWHCSLAAEPARGCGSALRRRAYRVQDPAGDLRHALVPRVFRHAGVFDHMFLAFRVKDQRADPAAVFRHVVHVVERHIIDTALPRGVGAGGVFVPEVPDDDDLRPALRLPPDMLDQRNVIFG